MIQTIVLNTDEHPVKSEHICFYADIDSENHTRLFEVETVFYNHPEAQGQGLLPRIETKLVAHHPIASYKSAQAMLLIHANKNVNKHI